MQINRHNCRLTGLNWLLAGGLWLYALAALADEHFDTLTVKGESFTNVTITEVSKTDIYFIHARGMDNAKLKDLDPALQKHFGYNSKVAAKEEQAHVAANKIYHDQLLKQKPPGLRRQPMTLWRRNFMPVQCADNGLTSLLRNIGWWARPIRGENSC